LVRQGETVLVRDRNRVVARIEPAGPAVPMEAGELARVEELERRGVIRRPQTTLTLDMLRGRPAVDADVVGALLAEREEGR
jgi:antitoxin (DNA-binding transcriptional repressor) of toxin-antitoxin stability system